MRPLKVCWYALITALALWGSGVIPAIIPAAVPTASKRGIGARFQLNTGGAPTAGDCPTWDANGDLVDSGIATCGGGASGGSVSVGAIASRPSAGTAGAVYVPTDSWYNLLYDNGSSWQYFYQGRTVTPPSSGSFTFGNQGGSSTTVQTNGAITLNIPTSVGDSLRFYYLAAPGSTPYTKTFRITQSLVRNGSNPAFVGACFQESSTSKLVCLYFGGGGNINVAKWTNETTFSANTTNLGAEGTLVIGMAGVTIQLGDDGTNLTYKYSSDNGATYVTVTTTLRNNFFTTAPNRVGVVVDNNSNFAGSATIIGVD